MMESRAKIAAVQAEADGMARLSVIRICPDGSGMESQLPPTLVDSCNASLEQRMLSASTPSSNLAIPTVSVVSAASLQRRAALLHHKRLHENNMQLQQPLSAEATQNMLRIFHDASLNAVKTAHNGLSLVDTGAEVGASDVYDDCFITVVDTSDVIRLQAFDHARSGLTVLGSSLQMKIVQDDQGALSVVITKRYIVQGTSGIDIICVDDVKQAGGAVFIGTLKDMKVVQDVAGKDYHYHLPGNSSYLISPLGGATKLVRSGKLHYLPSFDASQSPTEEINALMDDVHAVYGIASKSARLQSYTAAVEIAHGRRQQLIAVNALRTPPPDLSLFPTEALLDPHRTDEGFVDPMQRLFDSCYSLQVQAAICQDKDTEQRQQLLRTLEATAFELQDIAPSSTFIGNVRVGSYFAAEPHVDFTGGDVTTSTGPAPFTSSIAGISEAGVIGSSSNDPQGPSVTADNVKHGMFRPKGLRIVVMNAGQIADLGTPREVYLRPKSLFSAAFMGEVNQIAVQNGQTALGPLLPGTGTLLIRPECIGLTGPLPLGPCTVTDAAFFGTHVRAHVTPLAADLRLTVHLPQSTPVEPGQTLTLYATDHHMLSAP